MSRGVSNKITYKPYSQNEQWLLPPSLDELVPENHFVRIVSKTVDELRIEEVFEKNTKGGANIECGQTWISDKTLEKIANALHLEEYLLFIPETEISSNLIENRQKMIAYLKSREKELGDYVKNFFSATFDKILDDK